MGKNIYFYPGIAPGVVSQLSESGIHDGRETSGVLSSFPPSAFTSSTISVLDTDDQTNRIFKRIYVPVFEIKTKNGTRDQKKEISNNNIYLRSNVRALVLSRQKNSLRPELGQRGIRSGEISREKPKRKAPVGTGKR